VKYGERAVLKFVKRKMTALTEQIAVASQQIITNNSTLLCEKPISGHCIGDTLSKNT
jgi:hypothetical protein